MGLDDLRILRPGEYAQPFVSVFQLFFRKEKLQKKLCRNRNSPWGSSHALAEITARGDISQLNDLAICAVIKPTIGSVHPACQRLRHTSSVCSEPARHTRTLFAGAGGSVFVKLSSYPPLGGYTHAGFCARKRLICTHE